MISNNNWDTLLANFVIVSFIPLGWDLLKDKGIIILIEQFSMLKRRILFGCVLGSFAALSTMTAKPFLPGFVFDLRSALVALAGLFGGIPAGIIAVLLAGAGRLYVGGPGALAGTILLPVVACMGIIVHYVRRPQQTVDFLLFGLLVGVGGMFGYLLLPVETRWIVFASTAVPTVTMNVFTVLLFGLAINYRIRDVELNKTRAILAAMVEELPDCLNVKDLQGRFLIANDATARLMGAASSADLIGRTDFDFYTPDLAHQYRRDEEAFFKTGQAYRTDQPYVFQDGCDGWLATLKAPLRNEEGHLIGVITHNRDITDEKRARTVKNDFVSTVSHELRTPLTSIRGALGLIAGGAAGVLPPKAASLLKVAYSNSERLVRLINDILDIERMSAGTGVLACQRTSVAEILNEAVLSAKSFLPEKQINLVVNLQVDNAEAELDPDRFRQVLDNLISNAIKYSPVAGEVEILLRRLSPGFLRLSICDQGAGIPMEFRSRIFGKFERSDSSDTRAIGGSGLGLSIAKSIIEQHGGIIGFQDRASGGTMFYIDFPGAVQEASVTSGFKNTRPGGKILYVESNEDLARIIAGGLQLNVSFQRVGTLRAAREALALYRYDIVIMDILLPDGNGLHLLSEIPLTTSIVLYSSVEHSEPLLRSVDATFIKTRTAEVDVLNTINRIITSRLNLADSLIVAMEQSA